MAFAKTYNRLTKLIENETIESTLSWGMRMAIAATIPIVWGMATGRLQEAIWLALTAECICWMELKGSFGQGARVLLAGMLLTLVAAVLGTLTATNLWLSIICMLGIGFVAGLFKNLGDRGSGLAICLYVMYLLTNYYPVGNADEFYHRIWLVALGGVWNTFVGIFITLLMPAREPYRRTIALIWRSIGGLVDVVAKGWDGNGARSNSRGIYLKEKEVRTAIDNSFHFYESMAHQVKSDDENEYHLAQFRKATALVASHIAAISEELESLTIRDMDAPFRLKMYASLKAMQQTAERMAVYVITLQAEEKTLLNSRISRLHSLMQLLKEYPLPDNNEHLHTVKRVIQLQERTIKLIESALQKLDEMGSDEAVFRSYPLIKTIFVLHPKHWVRNLQLLFNLDTFTARYALRSAAGAMLGLFIYKWYGVDHGFWIPFTAMIVTQPYFGATIKKAFDRVIGTVLGGLAGGLILRFPTELGIHLKELMLFLSFLFMVYFIKKNYAASAFFITFSLVLLFNIEESYHEGLLLIRMASTIGGAALAIIAGFAVLPSWDAKWLPIHLGNAIAGNYKYFIETFYTPQANWTRNKRSAESKNSNAFDSFNRFMQEPSLKKKAYGLYYHIITHNVRITRELNNIHLEQESRTDVLSGYTQEQQAAQINKCLEWFNKVMLQVQQLNNSDIALQTSSEELAYPLTQHQKIYLDKLLIELQTLHRDLEKLNHKSEEHI